MIEKKRKFWGWFCILFPILSIPVILVVFALVNTLIGADTVDTGEGSFRELMKQSIDIVLLVLGLFAFLGLSFISFGIYLLRCPKGIIFEKGEYEYVGFWWRFLISILDGFFLYIAFPLQIFLYFKYGTSLARLALGARIIDEETKSVPSAGALWGRTALKNLFLIIGNNTLIGYLLFLPVGINKQKRGWHDQPAGTSVVKPKGRKSNALLLILPAILAGIIILGILATISTATFSGYFKKARDVERETFIENASYLMQASQINQEIPLAPESGDALKNILEGYGATVPTTKNNIPYVYGKKTTNDTDYVLFTCREGANAQNKFDGYISTGSVSDKNDPLFISLDTTPCLSFAKALNVAGWDFEYLIPSDPSTVEALLNEAEEVSSSYDEEAFLDEEEPVVSENTAEDTEEAIETE